MNTLKLTDDEVRALYWLASDGLMYEEGIHDTTDASFAAWNKLVALRNALPQPRAA